MKQSRTAWRGALDEPVSLGPDPIGANGVVTLLGEQGARTMSTMTNIAAESSGTQSPG